MESVVFGLFGTGGFAREIMPLVCASVGDIAKSQAIAIYFVESEPENSEINGIPVLSEKEFMMMECDKKFFNIAIGDSQLRQSFAEKFEKSGMQPLSLRDPSHKEFHFNEIGVGSILCASSIVTSNAKIGRYFHANLFSYVAHDCVIGDFVTFAPRVNCNGNVRIGDHAYIGTGATIKQGRPGAPLVVGERAVVGMGAVVTKDVPPGVTVVGNPAKQMTR